MKTAILLGREFRDLDDVAWNTSIPVNDISGE
jgi:hypothetical protein